MKYDLSAAGRFEIMRQCLRCLDESTKKVASTTSCPFWKGKREISLFEITIVFIDKK